MANIYESIADLITPARIGTAATTLDESEKKISAGAGVILPSLLARLLKVGDTPEVEEVLRQGKKIKAWENYDNVWQGSGVDEHVNFGERMENRLLSSYNPRFNTAVGHMAGLRAGDTDRLTNWVAATIGAWFSQQMAGGKSLKSLLEGLSAEKEALKRDIPADLAHEAGLAEFVGIHAGTHHAAKPAVAVAGAAAVKAAAPKVAVAKQEQKPKRSLAWLWWLLGLIIAALLICWAVRSCHPRTAAVVAPVKESVETKIVHKAPVFEAIPMVLPDGTRITMYKGDLTEAIKSYLGSDKFKNATEDELRSVWFEFTDINFEFNDSVDLMKDGPEKLGKVVDVLKQYPNVKVKVGSFGDRRGDKEINFEISDKRAETIINTIRKAGFPAKNLSFEGFGKQFAKVPVEASNDQRAPDRDVAMRFTK